EVEPTRTRVGAHVAAVAQEALLTVRAAAVRVAAVAHHDGVGELDPVRAVRPHVELAAGLALVPGDRRVDDHRRVLGLVEPGRPGGDAAAAPVVRDPAQALQEQPLRPVAHDRRVLDLDAPARVEDAAADADPLDRIGYVG